MEYKNPLSLLKESHLPPQKDLGQNFLVDSRVLTDIVTCANISKETDVLEVGTGLGSLTFFLAQAAQHVISIEIDKRLIPLARQTIQECKNVTLIHEDILAVDLTSLRLAEDYIVVANIPYYITSAIIRKLLTASQKPSKMVLTIQEEVAERICAQPGKMSLLALSVQVFGVPKTVLKIPASAFYPNPKVDSATLIIDLFEEPAIPENKLDVFFQLIKAGFSQKRKMLRNTLSADLRMPREKVDILLEQAGIDPQRRAQTLSMVEWSKLTNLYSDQGNT